MKTTTLLLLVGATVLTSSVRAQPDVHREKHPAEPGRVEPRETITFLGVETQPVNPTLTEQLNLPKGVGLVVRVVVPDSPAANVLKPHDILTKLNDQMLIETRQLAVLVRSFKSGDEITLTFVRGGKENTARVKLTTHEAPRMTFKFHGGPSFGVDDEMMDPEPDAPLPADHMLRVLRDHGPGPGEAGRVRVFKFRKDDDDDGEATALNIANSHLLFSDDHGSLDLTIKDGQKVLVAKGDKGEKLFDGPVNTPEERKSLPPLVRVRLERMEHMDNVSFEPGPGFKGRKSLTISGAPADGKLQPPLDGGPAL